MTRFQMYGIIYVVRNKINGKSYVGQTTGSLIHRKAVHYSKAKTHKSDYYFHNALNKYKRTDWEWKVLGYADCQFGLDTLEKSWMWIRDSMAPDGYNTKEGGSRGKQSEETRKKLSEMQKGKKNHMFGKHHTEKSCKKMSEAQKGNTYRRKLMIIIVDDNGCEICISHEPNAVYPKIQRNGKQQRIRHFIYEQWKGPVPKRMAITPICENKACINISHLELKMRKL